MATKAAAKIPKITYVGRTTNFSGKTLWEIVGNLKNFGVGRIVVRQLFQRYEEPTFFKIVKVEALPNENERKVKVFCEQVNRGVRYPETVLIEGTSYKADYRLIPKDQEKFFDLNKCYTVEEKKSQKLFPQKIEFPPLLKRFLVKEGNPNPKMNLVINEDSPLNLYRKARDGEKPTVEIDGCSLGKPASSKLYKGLDI